MNIPEIPPFNPNARRRREEGQGHHNKLPGPQEPQRPATTTVLPLTPHNTNARSQQQAASQTTGSKTTHRNSAAPTSSSHAAPEGAHSSSSSRHHQPGHTSSRYRVCFGPYTLLQTLGEGEFGKVKLGVRGDTRWGEEVAIKLIKRGSIQDSQQRMTKVAREIQVLKMVKHPFIVRLHDVIETEKYIGIVLEYASGGELFDHILAHRYLKDRDAQRLFSQLISAVAYLHEKKVVHRDLKLENLLLDRKRNIIVTDFGFANRFEDKESDLMATSCGSPCYAAPELVVQDGRYVGSAVDVWSCGVILYAMLAGYLPYDDDPANPDSENINLLYKYIINTELTFPDWISAQARDLLHIMLVPDPTKRCSLEQVMAHSYLRDYSALFNKSVQEVEAMAAQEDEERRRASENKKEKVLQAEAEAANGSSMSRSQSSNVNARHQSAIVVPTSSTNNNLAASLAPSAGRPQQTPQQTNDKRRAHAQSAMVVPTSAGSKASSAAPSTSPTQATADGFSFNKPKHMEPEAPTMQPSSSAPPRPQTNEEPPLTVSTPSQPVKHQADDTNLETASSAAAKKRRTAANRYTVQVEYDPQANGYAQPRSSTSSRRNSQIPVHVSNPASPTAKAAAADPEAIGTPTKIPVRSRRSSALDPDTSAVDVPESNTQRSRKEEISEAGRAPDTAGTSETRQAKTSVPFPDSASRKDVSAGSIGAASTRSRASRHSKAQSVVSMARFLPGNHQQQNQTSGHDQEAEVLDDGASQKRKSRRKALSMVVDPFKSSSASTRSAQNKRTSVRSTHQPPQTPSSFRSRVISATPQHSPAQKTQTPAPQRRPAPQPPVQKKPAESLDHGPSGGKAKRVMDWFRWKSMPHDTAGASFEKPVSAPKTDFDRQSTAERRVQDDAPAPHVVVTNDSHPQTRSQSKGPLNIPDQSSPKAAEPSTAALKAVDLQRDASMASARTATSAGTSQEQHQTQAKVQEPFNDNKLRFHQGAVDQNALTSRSPPHVLLDLRKTLFALGIEAREEGGSAFRLKCIRPSSKKTAAAYGMSVAALYGQANSRDAPNPGLGFTRQASGRVVNSSLTASPSSTFKSLFTRRGSSHSQMGPSSPALSQSSVSEAHGTPDLLLSPLAASTSSLGQNGSLPLPFYGGKDDPGAEVRFTVEISRMKGLPDLYAIDIRRLKGSLWSYRAIYHEIISKTPLDQNALLSSLR